MKVKIVKGPHFEERLEATYKLIYDQISKEIRKESELKNENHTRDTSQHRRE